MIGLPTGENGEPLCINDAGHMAIKHNSFGEWQTLWEHHLDSTREWARDSYSHALQMGYFDLAQAIHAVCGFAAGEFRKGELGEYPLCAALEGASYADLGADGVAKIFEVIEICYAGSVAQIRAEEPMEDILLLTVETGDTGFCQALRDAYPGLLTSEDAAVRNWRAYHWAPENTKTWIGETFGVPPE